MVRRERSFCLRNGQMQHLEVFPWQRDWKQGQALFSQAHQLPPGTPPFLWVSPCARGCSWVVPKSHSLSKCCSVLTPLLTRCPKPSLLHLLIKSNPTLQLYFIMKHCKRILAENLPHFQVRKGFLWRGKGAALQQTSLFSPSCTPVQLPVTPGEEQPSDLRSLNGCKNLWGETKYLGNSCCWAPRWFEVLGSVWERCQCQD